MTDRMNFRTQEIKGRKEQRLNDLAIRLEKWKNDKNRILTDDNIDALWAIAEKHANRRKLSPREREMKSYIHQTLRDAFSDTVRMVECGFFAADCLFDPEVVGATSIPAGKTKQIYDPERLLKKDFPVNGVALLVKTFVQIFGDEYGIELANALEEGYRENQYHREWWIDVEVPVVKKLYVQR